MPAQNDPQQKTVFDEILSTYHLTLDDLGLAQIDAEIERLRNLNVEKEKQAQKNTFLNDLQNFRKITYNNIVQDFLKECNVQDLGPLGYLVVPLYGEIDAAKARVLDKKPVSTAHQIASMLSKLKYTADAQAQDALEIKTCAEQYQQKCDDTKKDANVNFLRAVVSVFFSGIGFVAGLVGGAVHGFFDGFRYCGIGALVTTPYHTYKGAIEGAKEGNRFGKWLTNAPEYSSTKRHLFFQPPAMESAALEVAKTADAFIKPIPESYAQEHQVDNPINVYNSRYAHMLR